MTQNDDSKKKPKKIGAYLDLDRTVLNQALDRQRQAILKGSRPRLGELLLQEGSISPQQLDRAIHNQRLDRLRDCRLFSDLDPREIEALTHWVREIHIEDGQVFIRQDECGDCFFLLVSGRALVFRGGEYGEEIPLAEVAPGESIGEMGYFSDGCRAASVRARGETLLLEIQYEDLDRLFTLSPRLSKNFLDLVTSRLRNTNIRFQEVTVQGRVAERSLDSLRRFLDLSEIQTLSEGIEGLIERVVITASKVLQADRASLFLLDPHTGELWSKVAEGVGSREIRIPIDQGVAGWVARNGKLLNIGDAYADPRFDASVDRETGYRTRTILCGPVQNLHGEIVGVIQAINKTRGTFDSRDESLFKAFAYQTAIAVENFRLYRKLILSHGQLAVLLDVSISLSTTLDLNALILNIINKISEVLDAERSTLFLVDREKGELWSMVALGGELAEIRIPLHLGLAGHVAVTGTLLNVQDVYQDPRFNPEVDRETGFTTRDILTVPVINRDGNVIGVTQAINKKGGHFDQGDERLLQALTAQIAVALENAQLHRRTVEMKNYLVSVQDSISNSILTLDQDWRVVYANEASKKLFQTETGLLLGQNFREILGKENKRLTDHLQWLYHNRQAVVDYDLELTLAWGKKHFVNINFVALVHPNEDYQGLVLVFEDITREKRIKGTMSRYLAKDILDRILEDPEHPALGGLQNKATIMFTDIRGFTSLAEGMSAPKTVEFLNEYFSQMVDVLFENQGVLDKYIGDAIMAVFGVPYPQPDDAIRAVKTALDMKTALARVNVHRMTMDLPIIRVGMGLATGDVVSGNIGSERRMDYTVIGDGVNIAARLEGLTRHFGADILISESTHQEIKDHFCTRMVDRVRFLGKKQPVLVFEVLGGPNRKLTPAEISFHQGLKAYQDGDFSGAARFFSQGLAEDPLCRLFLARCHRFQSQSPLNWDGVWVSDQK